MFNGCDGGSQVRDAIFKIAAQSDEGDRLIRGGVQSNLPFNGLADAVAGGVGGRRIPTAHDRVGNFHHACHFAHLVNSNDIGAGGDGQRG